MNRKAKEKLYRDIGRRIKEARKRRGLSQDKLSKRCYFTRTSIVNIEQGRQMPPIYGIYDLARALKVRVRTLIPGRRTD